MCLRECTYISNVFKSYILINRLVKLSGVGLLLDSLCIEGGVVYNLEDM